MNEIMILKALSDETRMKILRLLLEYDYCVKALSRKLNISESAVSQHIKILKNAGLLYGQKKGYFMHYEVNREVLYELSREIESIASIKQKSSSPDYGKCKLKESNNCINVKNKRCNNKKCEVNIEKNCNNCDCECN